MPSGADNVLTIHTTDGTERFRIDSSGNVKVGSAATISPDGDLFVTGVCTATTLSGAASGLTGALPAISAANLTNVPAANVTGTLPAISGANLTNLTSGNLTGALPAVSAASLTSIPAANIVGVATAGFGNASGAYTQGVTMTDAWRITSSAQGNQNPIQNNLERVDTTSYGVLGSAMTVSSGIWTFPITGIYRIDFQLHGWVASNDIAYLTHYIQTTNNNSSYVSATWSSPSAAGISGANQYMNGFCSYIFDVTDTSTHKVKFVVDMSNTSAYTTGGTDVTYTGFFFTRLGDT